MEDTDCTNGHVDLAREPRDLAGRGKDQTLGADLVQEFRRMVRGHTANIGFYAPASSSNWFGKVRQVSDCLGRIFGHKILKALFHDRICKHVHDQPNHRFLLICIGLGDQ
jgi:hypothetical protein